MGEIYDRIEKYNNEEDVIGAYDYELRQQLIIESKFEQGIEQGSMQEKIKMAKNLFRENMNIEFIKKVTGLSIQKLKGIMKEDQIRSSFSL